MKIKSFEGFLGLLLFIACCFPYISPVETPFDTQPYAIVFSVLILFLFFFMKKDLLIPKLLLPFIFVLGYSFVLFINSNDTMMGLRSIVGYTSVVFIALAGFATFKYIKGRHFIFAVSTWLTFGLIQLIISKDFGSFMLPRLSTSETRGITSLAAEPSFYGITCLFFFVLNDIFYSKKAYSKKVYIFIFALLCVQMLLSRAGVAMMLFALYLFAKMISQKNIVKFIKQSFGLVAISLIFLGLFVTVDSLKNSRMGYLLNAFIENPKLLIYTDGSIADRLVHIILSHISIFYSYGMGLGLGNWSEYSWTLANWAGGFPLELAQVNITERGRIMSGWGTPIFELGIVGLVFLFGFIYVMYRCYKSGDSKNRSMYLSSCLIILFIMLNAVPISYPLFGYLIGVFMYLHIEQRVEKDVVEKKTLKLAKVMFIHQ